MAFILKKIVPHIIVVLLFIITALAYFNPVLSGKKLYQSDIVQYKGNARQLIDHREATGEELYWTDAVFGGMPTYQLGARYNYDFIDSLDRAIRFLPRPADYLFLYFISFYILMLVLRVDYKVAAFGALAFGFSTYLIIILGVGHNSKAHAIAYFPMVLAGILLVFQKRYILGFLLTAIAMALELQANHPQMTYYLGLGMVILGIVYLIDAIKSSRVKHYALSVGLITAAVLLSLGTNAANLLSTSEYAAQSTRGKSNLTINPAGEEIVPSSGLDYDYITQYSYGIAESLNLLVPRFSGGGSGARPPEDGESAQFIMNLGASPAEAFNFLNDSVPLYWGDQIIVEAPAYLGISVVFLAIIALFLVGNRMRWWTLGVITLALLLSYGKNFNRLTRFFVDYVPLYDKFRAVTSIQVLIELIVPMLAAVGLWQLLNNRRSTQEKLKAFKIASIILGSLLVVLYLFGGSLFDFASPYDAGFNDSEQLGPRFVSALREDRLQVMKGDVLRSLLIVGIICALLFIYFKGKLKEYLLVIGLTVVVLADLLSFNAAFITDDDYVSKSDYDIPFSTYEADAVVLRDKTDFRVYDLLGNAFNTGRTAYFHKTLGGYHGAKPRRIQELDEFYLRDEIGRVAPVTRENIEILSMFNVKYILDVEENKTVAKENPQAMGAAWFVKDYQVVPDDNTAILALENLSQDSLAIITTDQSKLLELAQINKDSLSTITVTAQTADRIVYKTKNKTAGLAIFSEMYYPHGWQATIDGKSVPIARVNYTLRGLHIPAGEHEIIFAFEPEVVKTGSTVMLTSNIVLILLLLGGGFYAFKQYRNHE